jgi:hypothetical protein
VQDRVFLNFRVGRERAERNVIFSDFDTAQLVQVPDVDVILVWKFAGFEQHHQVSTAGEGFPLVVARD